MLILLLAFLGVSLAVVVALLAVIIVRRRWVARQPGVFKGVMRVSSGEAEGFGPKWRKGYGRWIRDILVWTKGPFYFRNELVPADAAVARAAEPREVKRLGEAPVVVEVVVGTARVLVAAHSEDRASALGPYTDARDSEAVDSGRREGRAG